MLWIQNWTKGFWSEGHRLHARHGGGRLYFVPQVREPRMFCPNWNLRGQLRTPRIALPSEATVQERKWSLEVQVMVVAASRVLGSLWLQLKPEPRTNCANLRAQDEENRTPHHILQDSRASKALASVIKRSNSRRPTPPIYNLKTQDSGR